MWYVYGLYTGTGICVCWVSGWFLSTEQPLQSKLWWKAFCRLLGHPDVADSLVINTFLKKHATDSCKIQFWGVFRIYFVGKLATK